MNRRNKYVTYMLAVVPVVLALLLTGCWDQRIFEQTGFILQIGIESGTNGKILFSRTAPVITEAATNEIDIFVNEADLVREAREQAKRESPKSIEGGKTQQIYFSAEFAEKGIHEIFEVFERSPANPLLANVVVVDGSPRELMEAASKFKDKPRPAFYINYLLESNRQDAYVPETRIFDFDIAYFAEGIDPMTPRIRLKENAIEVTGTALFDGDKMVGRIDPTWTGLLLAMKDERKATEYVFQDKSVESYPDINKRGVAVQLRESESKINTKVMSNRLQVRLALKFETALSEYKWDDMDDDKVQKELEEQLSKSVTEECNKLIRYMQEVGSDPVGFGEIVRVRHNEYWKTIEWKKAFRQADITAEAKVDILRYGAIN